MLAVVAVGLFSAALPAGPAGGSVTGVGVTSRIAFVISGGSGRSWGLAVSSLSGAGRRALTRLTGRREDTDPVWSPDGRVLAFSRSYSGGRNGLYVIRADGGGLRRVVAVGAGESVGEISWSPDGSQLAFVRRTGAEPDSCPIKTALLLVDVDGRNLRRLPARGPTAAHVYTLVGPSWSRDGTKLVYIVDGNCGVPSDANQDIQGSVLYSIRADGTERRLLAGDTEGSMTAAVWSPDASRVAYTDGCVQDPGPTDWCAVAVIDADGSRRIRLTPWASADTSLGGWTADGTKIAFGRVSCRHPTRCGIALVDALTGKVRMLTSYSYPSDLSLSTSGTSVSALATAGRRVIVLVSTLDGRQHWRFPAPPGVSAGDSSQHLTSITLG
jgi:Tol biopolymer transport system component